MATLFRLLARAGSTISNPFNMPRHYLRPRRGDAQDDFSRIAQSMRVIGDDFRRVAAREMSNEQTYQRQRAL